MKECSKCKETLPYEDFHKMKASKDGYKNQCKECRNEKDLEYRESHKDEISDKQRQYRLDNPDIVKQRKAKYYEENKEVISSKSKKYRQSHKEEISERSKRYREENPELVKEQKKKYYQDNKEMINKKRRKWYKENPNYMKEYMKEYTKDNVEYKNKCLEYRLSDRGKDNKNRWMANDKLKNPYKYAWRTVLNNTLKRFNTTKSDSTINMLGYSADELKSHLESLLTEGMSWDNHGEWHIDHKKPVSLFDPETDMSIVNALDNLQPLWADVNLSKGNNYNEY